MSFVITTFKELKNCTDFERKKPSFRKMSTLLIVPVNCSKLKGNLSKKKDDLDLNHNKQKD